MNRILDTFHGHKYYKLYITGPGNFREQVATTKVYKGNRDPTHKPEHYSAIRDYMKTVWQAEVVEGREADDAIGCEQYANKDKTTVIVTIDKDLNQIPGYHYNPRKQEMYYVTKHSADIFFWKQMMVGDVTDNIPGITGIGDKRADKVIKECGGDLNLLSDRVRQMYQQQYPADWMERMREIALLLYIQRTPDGNIPFQMH